MTSSTTSTSSSGQVEHPTGNELDQKTPEALDGATRERLSVLNPSKRALVAKRAAGVPISARLGYLRAALGEGSPRQAIKAFCLECTGWDRAEVTRCTAKACPLFEFRPFANDPETESGKNQGW